MNLKHTHRLNFNNMFVFNVTPVPKPRMTRADAWKDRAVVNRYWNYKSDMQKRALEAAMKVGTVLELIFLIPMPETWSKRKKELYKGTCHQQKPDNDNLVKAFCDALTIDDCKIWKIDAEKYWWDTGMTLLITNDIYSGRFEIDSDKLLIKRGKDQNTSSRLVDIV